MPIQLTGFLQPTAGQIQIGDFSIKDGLLEIKKILGYRQRVGLAHAMMNDPELLVLTCDASPDPRADLYRRIRQRDWTLQ